MQGEKQRTIYDGLEMIRRIAYKHIDQSWRIRINFRFRTAFGMCDYNNQILSFNKYLVQYANDYHLRQLALHEIAHALTPSHGHDSFFKKKCKEIGCNTEERYFRWDMRYCFPEGMYPFELKRLQRLGRKEVKP